MINKIKLDLENCYGIKKLKEELDFTGQRVVAIYTPNGSMKTSLAQTFLDLSKGEQSKDRYFPARTTKRKITDDASSELAQDKIFSIRPYDEEFKPSEEISILLVDNDKRKEYESIHKDVNSAKEKFLGELKDLSQSRKDLEKEISSAFMPRDDKFYDALIRIENEVVTQTDEPFSDILYDELFNDSTLTFLGASDVQAAIKEYIDRYNELLATSIFFKKGVFNYYNAGEVAKVLVKNGFFKAPHSVTLNSAKGTKIIQNEKELTEVIEEDKQRVLTDKALKKTFDSIQTKIDKNQGLRNFGEYISNNEKLLPHLSNIGELKQNIWKSYFKTKIDLFTDLLKRHRGVLKRSKEIEDEARAQQTQWEIAIKTFNERFHVPFKLVAKNKWQVIIGQERALTLDFTFNDNGQEVPVTEDALREGLSTGEAQGILHPEYNF